MASAPAITEIRYDGATAKVWWTPSTAPQVTGYVILASSADSGIQLQSPFIGGQGANYGVLTTGVLPTGIVYTLQVQAQNAGGQGPTSLQLPLVTERPRVRSAWYDGTNVYLTWRAVAGAAANGYALYVYSTDSGTTAVATISDPSAERGIIPQANIPGGHLDPTQQWVVQVFALGLGLETNRWVSALSPALDLPKPLPSPALSSAEYQAGTAINAGWPALPASSISQFVLELTSPQDDSRQAIVIPGGTATHGVLHLPQPLAPQQQYAFRLLALTSDGVGVATAAQPVMASLPQIVSATYDGANVALVWQPPPIGAVQSYLLRVTSLSSGNTFTAPASGSATTGSVQTGTLDAAQTYVASVVAQNPGTVVAGSPVFPLLPVQPQITALAYDGSSIEVGWGALAGAARYVANLFKDGTLMEAVDVADPLATSARLPLSAPLGAGTWTIGVTALTAGGAAAVSAARTLPTTLPALTRAAYASGSLEAAWGALAGAASFTLGVHSPVTGAHYQTTVTSGTTATLTLPGVLGDETGYLVALSAKLADGTILSAPPVPLITAIPPLTAVSYDGATVTVRWEPVVDNAATVIGYTAKVLVDGSSTVYAKAVDDPFAAAAVIDTLPPTGLDPALTYHALVEARADNGVVAVSRREVVVSALPQPSNPRCFRDRIVANWTPVGGANAAVNGYMLTAASPQSDVTYTVFIPGIAATGGVLPLAQPLSPNVAYGLSIAAVAPGGSQAVASTMPIVTSLPAVASAVYDGTAVALTWTPSQSTLVTSVMLQVFSLSSGANFTTPISNPQATSGSVSVGTGLDVNQLWQAVVWAQGPVAGVSESLTLLVRRPTLSSAHYNGIAVEAAWTPVIGAGVRSYTLLVTLPSGSQLAVAVPGERSATGQIALAAPFAAGTYTVAVRAEAGPVAAVSDALTLDVAQPAIAGLIYQAGAVSATWGEVTNTAVTGYLMHVRAPASARDFTQAIAGRSTISGTLTIGGQLASDDAWFFSLDTQTPAGISAGSTPAAIISDLPELSDVAYDGANVSARWAAQPDGHALLASFALTVRKQADLTPAFSQPIADPSARNGSVATGALDGAYVAEIRAVATSAAVTVSPPISVVVPKPALSTVAYDAGLVTAAWSAVSGLSQYRVGVFDAAGSLLAAATTTGTDAAVSVGLDPAQVYAVRLQGVAGISAGPLSDRVALLAAPAVIDGTEYAGGTIVATWQPPTQAAGITGYLATLFADGIALPDTAVYDGNKATFTKSLTVNVAYAVAVRPTGAATSGPWSTPAVVLTAVPRMTSAILSGSRLEAAWQPATYAGITGYLAELYQGSTRIGQFDTEEAELSVALQLTAGAAYSVRVRARAASALGPWSDLFPVRSFGFQYFVQVAQANVQPYLFRTLKAAPANPPAEPIALYLPEIFNTAQANAITSGAFTLTPTHGTPYPYVLDFAADSPVWTFDNQSIRPTLQSDYDGFLKAVEEATGGLVPGGLSLLRDVLATGLPLTFYETLFYRYGFDPVNGYCNLQPGMTLRLDSEVFQFEGTSPIATQLSGFVVTGARDYEIADYLFTGGARRTGIDPFLATLQRPAVPVNSRGSGGIIDLYATGFRRRYYRMFYPADFTGGDSPGSIGITNNMALLGCDTWKALAAATSIYLSTGSFSGVTEDIAYTFFRGRMLAAPLITVLVNDTPQQVSLGTTVRGLVQRVAALEPIAATSISSLKLQRGAGALVNAAQTTLALDLTVTNPVNLTANPYQSVLNQPDAFDLPLLNGDRLTLGR